MALIRVSRIANMILIFSKKSMTDSVYVSIFHLKNNKQLQSVAPRACMIYFSISTDLNSRMRRNV